MLLSAAENAWAQTGPADAIALGHGAVELYEDQKYESALVLFRRADAVAHSPVFALYIARCQRNLGLFLAARGSYRAVLDERLAPDAPEPWLKAQSAAKDELSELEARIPSIVIEATFVPSGVQLNGEAIPLSTLGREIQVDPGPHRVALRTATGIHERALRLQAGERAVRVLFEVDKPGSTAVNPVVKPVPDEPAVPATSSNGLKTSVVAPLLLGTAAIAVGATAGIVALIKTQDLKAKCTGNACDPELEAERDRIQDWATVSTIAFTVGGAGLALGTVLHLADVRGSATRANLFVAGTFP
ncbi:MAG TPA: hypothetical protein VFZ53_14425 [Polyangiaceae bacterium]